MLSILPLPPLYQFALSQLVHISIIQISPMDGQNFYFFFFFCFLCYPYAIRFLLTPAPFILIYSPITTSTHATLFASLRIYHLYISRRSLVNGLPRKDDKLRIR